MTQDDYNLAYNIGFDAAREVMGRLPELSPDRDDVQGFYERVLRSASSLTAALDALPLEDEEAIAEPVECGIAAYWRTARIGA